MLHVKFSSDDTSRFATILRSGVLGDDSLRSFDSLTNTVRDQLDLPISAVSLITRGEQIFASHPGLSTCRTGRDVAFCDHALRDFKTLIVPDAGRDPVFADNALVTGAPHIRTYLGAPFRGPDGHPIGTLCAIGTEPREFASREIELVESLALVAEQMTRLHHDSLRDSLTGLMNRRAMAGAAERLFEEHQRCGTVHGLILMDLDHFKSVNDLFGHDAGDQVLARVARILEDTLPDTVLVGRPGGEEFAMLCPDVCPVAVTELGEAVRVALQSERFEDPTPGLRLTASFGTATLRSEIVSCRDWLNHADRALYRAKAGGRNRIEHDGEIHAA